MFMTKPSFLASINYFVFTLQQHGGKIYILGGGRGMLAHAAKAPRVICPAKHPYAEAKQKKWLLACAIDGASTYCFICDAVGG